MRHWRASDASLLQHWSRVPPAHPPGGYLGVLEGVLRVRPLSCSLTWCWEGALMLAFHVHALGSKREWGKAGVP